MLKPADEAKSKLLFIFFHATRFVIYEFNAQKIHVDSDRIAEYDMKLMAIDSDTLGIPETEYEPRVTMASSEFTRIVRDLSQLDESIRIEVARKALGERPLMVTCYFYKLKTRLRKVRVRRKRRKRRRKAMMSKWLTEMKTKRMTLNSSPNQMTTKVRKRKMMKPMKTGMKMKRRKSKKKVTSCKVVGDSDLHIYLALGKW